MSNTTSTTGPDPHLSAQNPGLIHADFAEREVAKVPEARPPSRVRSTALAWWAVAPWAPASPFACWMRACR
jgi:hypothetical protein